MKRAAIVLLVLLSACKTETASAPTPVSLTPEATGHYCQMNLWEHPGPKAQVHLKDVSAPLFFSQVRDAVAYQRMPEQSHQITAIFVNDMAAAASWDMPGADNWIPAARAVYVVGSSREGGMGAPELVPFATEDAARGFAARYGGQVRDLDEIADADVLTPVDAAAAAADTPDDEDDYARRLRGISEQGKTP